MGDDDELDENSLGGCAIGMAWAALFALVLAAVVLIL